MSPATGTITSTLDKQILSAMTQAPGVFAIYCCRQVAQLYSSETDSTKAIKLLYASFSIGDSSPPIQEPLTVALS
jgi:hypothetical protein